MKLKIRVGIFLLLVVLATAVVVTEVSARRWYYYYYKPGTSEYDPNGKSRCLADAGPYAEFPAVYRYACAVATRAPQEGCAAWLSAPGNPASTTIDVTGASGSVELSVYGMCTDNTGDTTSNLKMEKDAGSITLSSGNLTRGDWGSPISNVSATLNIDKFISGLVPSKEGGYDVYTRLVYIRRWRSDGLSTDTNPTIIKIRLTGGSTPPVTDLCGLWTPATYAESNPFGGETSVEIKNRNPRLSTEWDDGPVYAKADDTVEWYACYYPGVQATADTEVSSVNGTKVEEYEELSKTECMKPLPKLEFKLLKETEQAKPWENTFVLSGVKNIGKESNTLPIGDVATKATEGITRPITTGDTGANDDAIIERIESSTPTKATIELVDDAFEEIISAAGVCKNEYSNGPPAEATVKMEIAKDDAYVIVPYNFETSTRVDFDRGKPVYSGDKITGVKVFYDVTEKYNIKTNDVYTTDVDELRFALYAYVTDTPGGSPTPTSGDPSCSTAAPGSKQCVSLQDITKDDDGAPYGGVRDHEVSGVRDSYNAFDAAAGDYLCLVSAIWPASSGDDENTDPKGDDLWAYSDPACNIIAKKPTFQVWGGSLYSVGKINANISKKWNIYNIYHSGGEFDKTGKGLNIAFMPWVEESLVLKNGVTSTVASGAATGLNSNGAGVGNNADYKFDKLSALSFANHSTGSIGTDEVGNSGIDSNLKENKDREALIDYWTNGDTTKNVSDGGHLNLASPGGMAKTIPKDNATIRFSQGGNFSVSGTVAKGVTHLIKSSGTVTINGNIIYDDSGYTQISEIPKVIIYAKNIEINCSVDRIDAILITSKGGKTTTCSGAGDHNDSNRSKQLKIFGVAIADEIDLGRTYGNAANKDGTQIDSYGMPSDGAAAEIFDYDTSIFMWAQSVSGSANTDVLQTAYQHEVAPRY